jgi:hypothetical protein
MANTVFGAAALAILTTLVGCGSGYTIDLNSTNIDFNLVPQETPVGWGQKDIEKKKGEAEWVFSPTKNCEIAGLLIGSDTLDHPMLGVLASSVGIVWSRPGIELAMQSGGKPDMTRLSDEAKEILRKHGCAAPYLNQHTVSFITVGASEEISNALRGAYEGCGIYLKGMIVNVKSAKHQGTNISCPAGVKYLYVTELRINDKTYRAS